MQAKITQEELLKIKKLRDEVGQEHLEDAIYGIGIKANVISVSLMETLTKKQGKRIVYLLELIKHGKKKFLFGKSHIKTKPKMANKRGGMISFVYFISDGHYIKIGHSRNVETRMAELQVGSATKLKILAVTVGDLKLEKRYHRLFEANHAHGEWFYPVTEITDEIARLNSGKQPRQLNQGRHTRGGPIVYKRESRVVIEFKKPVTFYPFKNIYSVDVCILEGHDGLLYRLPNNPTDKYKHMPDHVKSLINTITKYDFDDVLDKRKLS